jgi:AcrR family transcriptional regulator
MTSTRPPAGIRKARAAQTEAALKAAARRVLEQRGYLEATVADITREAGRSVGSFYRHFAGKEELLQALLDDWLADAGSALTAHEAGDDLSQPAALRARVAVYWRTYRDHVPEIRALQQAALLNPRFAEQLARNRYAQLETMREHLNRLRGSGFDLPGDPVVLASAFNALMEGFCQTWLTEGGHPVGRRLSDNEAIDTLTTILQHGLLGERSEARRSASASGRRSPAHRPRRSP